jgi:hypothetical protein
VRVQVLAARQPFEIHFSPLTLLAVARVAVGREEWLKVGLDRKPAGSGLASSRCRPGRQKSQP